MPIYDGQAQEVLAQTEWTQGQALAKSIAAFVEWRQADGIVGDVLLQVEWRGADASSAGVITQVEWKTQPDILGDLEQLSMIHGDVVRGGAVHGETTT